MDYQGGTEVLYWEPHTVLCQRFSVDAGIIMLLRLGSLAGRIVRDWAAGLASPFGFLQAQPTTVQYSTACCIEHSME